jgi:hypothetical protein
LDRVMQKEDIPAVDLTCTTTSNPHETPGQANRYKSSEQRLELTSGPRLIGRLHKQRGGKSGWRVPGDRLINGGNQQRIL